MGTRNLFFVQSPLQIICAQEARERYCRDEKNHLVIIDRQDRNSIDFSQKSNEIDNRWHQISRHREPRRRGFFRIFVRLWNTILITRKHGSGMGKVFLGDANLNWFRMLGKKFGTEVIWLDDGAASINVIKDYEKRGIFESTNPTTPRLFSLFASTELERRTKGAVQLNTLDYLRQTRKVNQTVAKKRAVFIGQWLSERGGVNEMAEMAVLKRACADLPEWDLSYIRHRHESSEKLHLISQLMPVVTYERSIEATYLQADEVPELIISWYSTALFTLNHLFPEVDILSLLVPLSDATPEQEKDWRSVYDALKETGVEIKDYTRGMGL